MDASIDIKQLFTEDAEEALCGALFINPYNVMLLDLKQSEFANEKLGCLYQAIRNLTEKKQDADSVSVIEELKRMGKGGMWKWMELYALSNKTPSSMHYESYAKIIREKAKRRNIYRQAQELQRIAADVSRDTVEPVARVINNLTENASIENTAESIQSIAESFHEDLWDRINGKTSSGIMSGFTDFDKVTGGFQPGEMIIMSGVPGVGKSMLAMQIALQVSKNIPTVIYSLEMTKELVYRRMVSGIGKIDALHLKNGNMTSEEIQKYKDAAEEIESRKLYIADGGGWDLLTIKADIMKHKIRHGVRFAVIDYLYLIGDMANETDEVARTTVLARGVKRIAMELEIPLLVVHSMNKTGMDNNGVPGLSSLRGSGQVSYDSDMVLMLTKYNDSMGNLFLPQSELENIRGLFFVKGRDMPPMSKFVPLVKNPNYPDFRESVKR